MGTENQGGASGQVGDNKAVTPPATPPNQPKFEVKTEGDRQVMMVDGKKVVYEHELVAAKKGLELQMEQAQEAHNNAIDKAGVGLSETQTKLAAANAEVTKLTEQIGEARKSGATPDEVAKLKLDLETATGRVTTAETNSIIYRKKLITVTYPGVTEEQLKDKSSVQLDALEEALKAVANSRGGPGPYAIGGSGGSTGPMDEMTRAKAVIANTPYRGVREVAK